MKNQERSTKEKAVWYAALGLAAVCGFLAVEFLA